MISLSVDEWGGRKKDLSDDLRQRHPAALWRCIPAQLCRDAAGSCGRELPVTNALGEGAGPRVGQAGLLLRSAATASHVGTGRASRDAPVRAWRPRKATMPS